MPFVQCNEEGDVIGLFSVEQPGFAEEEMADDHADVLAFLQRIEDLRGASPE